MADDGDLGEASVVAVWDSLYHNISTALYAEAARWGDYRRDVHPYTTRGELYTVDGQYQKERSRLLTQYFPYRSEKVLNSIVIVTSIDDIEAPDGWEFDVTRRAMTTDGNDTYYDLQGHKIVNGQLRRGIYIHRGKKVVIRTQQDFSR